MNLNITMYNIYCFSYLDLLNYVLVYMYFISTNLTVFIHNLVELNDNDIIRFLGSKKLADTTSVCCMSFI